MDLLPILYWLYPLAIIPAVYFLSKEDTKPKFLAGILLAFVPWLFNAVGPGFVSAVATTFLLAAVLIAALRQRADRKFLLNDLTEKMVGYSNFLPKHKKKRAAVEKKAQELIKKEQGKPRKKYVLQLLINAYGRQVGSKKKILKELGSL